jgi:cytochrome c-type biogenesis protein
MQAANITYISAFVAGLLSFLSPCVLPLIPSYITYITGLSFADLQAEHPSHKIRQQTMLHSLAFILGFTAVFILLGASATLLGGFLFQYQDIVRKVGGVLIIIFGIHVTGLFNLVFLLGEKRLSIHRKSAGYLGTFFVGIGFAAGWTPCIGPILSSILMIAATERTIYRGITLLLTYSMGLAIPFFLSAMALHQFLVIFNRFKKYIRIFEIVTGVFLIIIGVLIFTDYFTVLTRFTNTWFGGGQ